MIAQDWLDDLKRRVDLVDLGSRYGVRWDTRGAAVTARCPFHDDSAPSFHALTEPRRGAPRYVCYGSCGRSWSAVAFLVDGHGLEFLDAVEELAQMAGMEVPRAGETEEARSARESAKARREQILAAIACAQEYFARALQADQPEAGQAREYVRERSLDAAVESWGLGLAPSGDGLLRWLDHHQIAPEIAAAAYLTRSNERGRYSFLRGRLTIPWCDRSGTVVAHVGRDLVGAEPKYLHPGEIPRVFVKGELVFGLHHAVREIGRSGTALVVEGQLSAITPHLHGLTNAVACGGKAFSADHARTLAGCGARRAVFVLDADPAGRQGAAAAVPIAVDAGLQTQVVELPTGQDPDDYLRAVAA